LPIVRSENRERMEGRKWRGLSRASEVTRKIRRYLEDAPNATNRLTSTILIFYQSKAHMLIAILAKPNARRDSHLGFLQQELENSKDPMER